MALGKSGHITWLIVLVTLFLVAFATGCAREANQSDLPPVSISAGTNVNQQLAGYGDSVPATVGPTPSGDGVPSDDEVVPDTPSPQEQPTQIAGGEFVGERVVPVPPPLSRWDVVESGPAHTETVDGENWLVPPPKMARSQGIDIEVLTLSISREMARIFVGIQMPGQEKPPDGSMASIVPGEARLVDEDGQPAHESQRIEPIVEVDGFTLALISLSLAGNESPELSLDVPVMDMGGSDGAQDRISGNWRIPLLVDQAFGAMPLRVTEMSYFRVPPYGIRYDNGVVVQIGDSMDTPWAVWGDSRFGGDPDIAQLWIFTITSATDGQPAPLYLFIMNDGSVKQVSKAEYDEQLNLSIYMPNPTAEVREDPDGPIVIVPPPPDYTPDPPLSVEEMIAEHPEDLTGTPVVEDDGQ